MTDVIGAVIALLIIILILTVLITKVVREKRKGVKCIGCPHSKGYPSNCNITIKK